MVWYISLILILYLFFPLLYRMVAIPDRRLAGALTVALTAAVMAGCLALYGCSFAVYDRIEIALWRVVPFILAVVILACNQTTGINSVLNYTVTIFQKTGMQGAFANMSDVAIKIVNCVMTVVACALVDRKGRKFLLKLGTGGIIVGLCGVGSVFLAISKGWCAASMTTGIVATAFFFMFIGFFAVGPGVCVWLALTELMPTRIRANGMAIAMIINQGVSAGIATVFPRWCAATNDNGTVFFVLAGFTVVYFITAAFFLPETKGRTLEEVEQYFKTGKMPEKNQ